MRARRAQRLRRSPRAARSGRARSSRRSRRRRSRLTSTPVSVTNPSRGSDSRFELFGQRLAHDLVHPRGARVLARRLPPPGHGRVLRVEPRRRDVEQLDVGRARDEPLDGREHLPRCAVAPGDHRDADRGPLPLVLVVDLGDGHAEPVPQPVDDRADRGALGLQRPALGHVEVEADRGRVHHPIVRPPGGPGRLSGPGRGAPAPPAPGNRPSSGGRRCRSASAGSAAPGPRGPGRRPNGR